MLLAVELSRKGWPAPNPRVGCILVKNGRVIAEGWHEAAGGPHAEAAALTAASGAASGSTAYVTLEPCAHFGRTPPCAQALIRAGVHRVVYAVPDPNPKAAGGSQVLKDGGVLVSCGIGQAEAVEANLWWLYRRFISRPAVILKAAMTQDGFMARSDGTSKWITSPESRMAGHRLRAEMGAVVTGWKTVDIDQPLLTARVPGVINQPKRIILDPRGCLSGREAALQGEEAVWVQAAESNDSRVASVHLDGASFNLNSLLAAPAARECMGLLVEGGPATLSAFIAADCWDEAHLFIGPGEFGDGILAPEELRLLAQGSGPTAGVVGREEALGEDRHLIFTKKGMIFGTISQGLKSIRSDSVF